MPGDNDDLHERLDALEREVAELRVAAQHGPSPQRVRKRSKTELFGLPLWEIATGPDPARGELRGHARAIFAIGDVATGLFALGGIARGFVCVGGITCGFLTVGGVSFSLLFALGGVAIAPLAFGGVALGGVAIGGAAIGIYAKGGATIGVHAINNLRRDPAAIQFFSKWLPGL